MLEARKLTKCYDDGLLALDKLDLRVDPGEVFCMFGANGAGKTTAVNLFLDFIEPTSGIALIEGIDVNRQPLEAKKHVSFVSENVMLYGNLTAYQNLDYFARLSGKRNLSRAQYMTVLSRAGLEETFHAQRIRFYSKGMRQKLAIAVAMVKEAPNVILDEPTSGLDPKAASEFLELLRTLRDAGKSILMSTHDIFRANEVADRVGFLKEGRLIMTRARSEMEGENLVELYLRSMGGEPVDPRVGKEE